MKHAKGCDGFFGKNIEEIANSAETYEQYLRGFRLDQIDQAIMQAAIKKGGQFPNASEVLLAIQEGEGKKKEQPLDKAVYIELCDRKKAFLRSIESDEYCEHLRLSGKEEAYIKKYEEIALSAASIEETKTLALADNSDGARFKSLKGKSVYSYEDAIWLEAHVGKREFMLTSQEKDAIGRAKEARLSPAEKKIREGNKARMAEMFSAYVKTLKEHE